MAFKPTHRIIIRSRSGDVDINIDSTDIDANRMTTNMVWSMARCTRIVIIRLTDRMYIRNSDYDLNFGGRAIPA